MTYLDFVEERHAIWYKRQTGAPQPWTDDPILAGQKFTNVFRVLDPGSQFVFELAHEDPKTTLMRLFLYRFTGRVEAWQALGLTLGYPESTDDLAGVLRFWQAYRGPGTKFQRVPWMQAGNPDAPKRDNWSYPYSVFTGAYMISPRTLAHGTDKMEAVIAMTGDMFSGTVWPRFAAARNQADRFNALRQNPGMGDFMAMQILTDWGYTSHSDGDRENEFVMAGPGAKRGAALIDPSSATLVTLGWAQRTIHQLPDCPLLGTRKPSLMDVQNTLCEFSKYARYASKAPKHPKKYRPAHPGPQPEPRLPEHWSTA